MPRKNSKSRLNCKANEKAFQAQELLIRHKQINAKSLINFGHFAPVNITTAPVKAKSFIHCSNLSNLFLYIFVSNHDTS